MMSSEGNKDIAIQAVTVEQSSTTGAKRKRGRPRKSEYPAYELPHRAQPIQSVPPLQSTQGVSNIQQVLPSQQAQGNQSGRYRNSANLVKTSDNHGNSGKDDILGKRFVGKMTNKFPGFCLITVKVKDNHMLKGWIPDQKNLNSITPKDDLTPELQTLRPSKVQKQASAIPMQAAPPVPIHLEDVTLARPLQMRRPVDQTIAKHAIPLSERPYMGSSVVAAVPVSVSPSNVETGTLVKQDTECMMSQSPVAAVPITSVRPVFVSGNQMGNQNELVGEKSLNDCQKDSESSKGAEVSLVKAENSALVDVAVKDSLGEHHLLNVQGSDGAEESSGTRAQTNSANTDHHSSKEPSGKSDQLETETGVLKGVDDSKSDSDPYDVHSAHDEHEMNVDK